MAEVVARELPVRARGGRPRPRRNRRFADDPLKLERIAELGDDETISVYTDGPFVDLCRGPHVPRHRPAQALQAAAPRRRVLARRRAPADAAAHLRHRVLQEGGSRRVPPPAGGGAEARPPRARQASSTCSCSIRRRRAPRSGPRAARRCTTCSTTSCASCSARTYQEIKTPLLYNKGLWEMSGHWGKYRENMFLVLDNETGEHDFSLKPMNCPSHYLLYRRQEALVPRAAAALQHVRRAAPQRGDRRAVGADARAAVPAGRLPHLPDGGPDRRRGEASWSSSSATTRRSGSRRDAQVRDAPGEADRRRRAVGPRRGGAARRRSRRPGMPYELKPGDGAFYGPKIDFDVTDSIGRTWQLGTIQLDYDAPGAVRPDVRRRGQRRAPAGGDPPRGERLVRAVHRHPDRALRRRVPGVARARAGARAADRRRRRPTRPRRLTDRLRAAGIRAHLDDRSETLNYRIRDGEVMKVPYMAVVGQREADSDSRGARARGGEEAGSHVDGGVHRTGCSRRSGPGGA